ncbi:MAG TPA: CopD family protein [Amycolatopsis sp.]|nr:CopD family protein [Amycolatopsis sp.]
MTTSVDLPLTPFLAAAAAQPTLGPVEDSAVVWTVWATVMGLVGLAALASIAAGPVARRIGPGTLGRATVRLTRTAVLLGVLAVPAILADLAHSASKSGGYHFAAAWRSLFDGSTAGLLSGLEVTLVLVGTALLAPLTVRRVATGRARPWLLGAGLAAGAVALGTTKFPTKAPTDWGRSAFETLVWMLHLFGGSVWIGGLAGLLLLALPGGVAAADRSAFWSATIRRFAAVAMSCVAAITLSGLFLYWEHVDGPEQLFTTLYGQVLGVKILIFGALLALGVVNQFWLHPRIEALRAAGDDRPLRTVLLRQFPAVVAIEVLLGLAVLFVAPFLHGSARTQAFQAEAAKHAVSADAPLPKLPAKEASVTTLAWGTGETVVVLVVMVAGHRLSGRLARNRARAAAR